METSTPLTAQVPRLIGSVLGLESNGNQTVILYTGTFEPYQGLDLLIDAAAPFVVYAPGREGARGGGGRRPRFLGFVNGRTPPRRT